MKRKIKKPTLDDLKRVDRRDKSEALKKRHVWLKEVRKKERQQVKGEYERVMRFFDR